MLKKRNLQEFYTQLIATNEMFRTVVATNHKLEREIANLDSTTTSEKPSTDSTTKEDVLSGTQKYIATHVKNPDMQIIAVHLLRACEVYGFKNLSSVPKRISIINPETGMAMGTSHERSKQINLLDHTHNCAICAIEVCKEEPSVVSDAVIIAAILHDFGKHPEVKALAKTTSDDHDHVGAEYAREFLEPYDIPSALKKSICDAIENRHAVVADNKTKPVPISTFARLLIASDEKARKMEEKFISAKQERGEK